MGYKRKEKESYLKIWHNNWVIFERLDMEQRGRVLTAMMAKAVDAEIPVMSEVEEFAFYVLAAKMDEDTAHFKEVCNKNAYNATANKGESEPPPTSGSQSEPEQASVSERLPPPTSGSQADQSKDHRPQVKDHRPRDNAADADSARARDPELERAIGYYQRLVNPAFGRMEAEEITQYTALYGADLLIYAVDKALAANKRTWTYIRAILKGWERQGVKTLADAQRLDADFEAQKQAKQTAPRQPRPPAKPKKTSFAEMAKQQQEQPQDDIIEADWSEVP